MQLDFVPHKNPIIKFTAETISEYGMFQPGDAVLMGVSGGPDSVALFHILHCLSEELKIRLAVGHLNHCLRGKSSENDARFAESMANTHNMPFYLEKKDVRQYKEQHKLSLEEAARDVRYAFLLGVAGNNGYSKIALGHHADDNAEQILMHLFRGSGPLGISGIPPVREGKIVRPLIKLKRDEILRFLKENRIDYVLDKSNEDRKHLRNRVRHDLIPSIKASIQPQITATLTRLAHITKAEEEWLGQLIEPIFEESIHRRLSNRLVFSVDRLKVMHPALQRRILRKAVSEIKGDLRCITYTHIESARKHLKGGVSNGSTDLPDRIRVSKSGMKLTISKEPHPLRETAATPRHLRFDYHIQKPETVVVKEIRASIKFSRISVPDGMNSLNTGHRIAFFAMNNVRFPLILRNFHPGDRFSPLGMTGTQKVKDFFINNKISREDRGKYPMLLSDGRIIWVVGLRIDDSVKVTSATRTVLKAEMVLLDDV
jgi:tRNA(Ile)-lysidine synthase